MRKSIIAILALGLVVSTSAARGDNVDIAVDNPGGSRTLYVEDLTGQALTDLDFGATRAQPFRVRVVDSTMDRTGFTVSSSMTNLYLDDGAGGLDFGTKIDSANVSISHPANPLNALSIAGRLQPTFDAVSTIADPVICGVLSLPVVGGQCTISVNDLQGKLQTVPLTVDLNDLTNLPLLPQGSDAGAFTNPTYEGLAALAPQPPSPPAATARQMLKGTSVNTAAVLSALDAALATVLGAQALGDMVDTGTVTAALRDATGLVWDALSPAQVTTVLGATVATAQSLVAAEVLGQTGTYLSLPLLSVDVPVDAMRGTYRGTLVVTGLQP